MSEAPMNRGVLVALLGETLAKQELLAAWDHQNERLQALETENAKLGQTHEDARVRAYRQARVFEPSMDGYAGAMAVYLAAFGPSDDAS